MAQNKLLTVRSARYWELRIKDQMSGETREIFTDFVGHLNIYWQWDDHDRLWVYSSDDGGIHVWEWTGGDWDQTAWPPAAGTGDPPPRPPPHFLPPYAEGRHRGHP